jgi:hypothetical protein
MDSIGTGLHSVTDSAAKDRSGRDRHWKCFWTLYSVWYILLCCYSRLVYGHDVRVGAQSLLYVQTS